MDHVIHSLSNLNGSVYLSLSSLHHNILFSLLFVNILDIPSLKAQPTVHLLLISAINPGIYCILVIARLHNIHMGLI